jgi:hypothetical protein
MAESKVFDWVAMELQRRTHLSSLEARGTLRLVLKDAGLDVSSVATFQMDVVLKRLMPSALRKRRVTDAAEICAALAADLAGADVDAGPAKDTAYDVFERLDGRRSKK